MSYERGWAAWVAVATFAGLFASSVAQAQVPGAQGQPQQRQERPDERPASARAAENYDAVGVPVGSFRLFPDLELDEVYNDNIFATGNGVAGRTASFVQLIKPKLDLRSDWNNHMLNLFARGNIGIFSATSLSNFQDVSVGTDGRFDIQRDWNVYGGLSWSHLHEDPGTPNAVTGAFPPTQYNQLATNVGYYQRFNRLNLRLDGRFDNYNFLNNGIGPAQGVVQNSDRNRNEFREAARVGYEFSPEVQIWTRGSLNQRAYVSIPDSSGFNRDSSGWDVVGGLTIDLGGITSLEAFAGYLQQNYADGRFSAVNVPVFGLTGYWNPIRELFVRPFIRRTVEDSSLTTAVAYLNTAGGIDVSYKARPNIDVDAHADYSVADYFAFPGIAVSRSDQYFTGRISVLYRPTREFYVGPSYQYIHRWSSQAGSEYDQNMLMLRLGARL
jgi:hypothetical protein